jgi:hypothetical protein
MTSLEKFSAFAASRGEGLHPAIRDLFERAAARPFSEVTVRSDGMLQAGPNPTSATLEVHGGVTHELVKRLQKQER